MNEGPTRKKSGSAEAFQEEYGNDGAVEELGGAARRLQRHQTVDAPVRFRFGVV